MTDKLRIECLYFSLEDLLQAGCLDMRMAIDAAEKAMLSFRSKDILFPEKIVQIFNEETQEQIALSVDEACTNVIKHAHHHNARRLMDIKIETDANKIKITITDKGKGFDITKLQDPDIEKYIKESKHGGLGIYLIKTLMDEVNYEFNPGVKNQVQLTKYLQKSITS